MNLFLFYLFLFSASVCKKEVPIADFKDIEVLFYNQHSQYELVEPVFDTSAVSYISVERHREGAQFETVSRQVEISPFYKEYKIQTANEIPIIINAETGELDTLQCFTFLSEPELVKRTAQYETISQRGIKVQGDGEWIEEKRDTFFEVSLISHGNYEARVRRFQDGMVTKFRIPFEADFAEYLVAQLDDSVDCFYGESYMVLD